MYGVGVDMNILDMTCFGVTFFIVSLGGNHGSQKSCTDKVTRHIKFVSN